MFGRYLLVQRLSRGGMGEIFLAKHGLAGFEKLAVIKKVLPHLAADEQFISRFVDEAQVAIKLQHVNVAQVFEVGRVGDEYFLALEYVDGRDLRRTLALLGHRRQRLPVDLALFITRELANGLAYAHRRTTSDGASLNLVHCDISPPNVLVSFEGETKVIDFGIAKSAMSGTTTDPKIGFGKFGYMAPEQLIRGGAVDHRTDLYAAGVVLYELLTGTRLYEAGSDPDYRALAKKVARGEHQLPSEIDPMLAPYDELVATALRPRPEQRYQTAAELRDAIQQCLVAVNPTISTDQLGAYMRVLFADEMTAQRELHERVASARLADFQDQFHTQTISTVSFALAQPPPLPTEATVWAGRRHATQPSVTGSRTTGPSPVVKRRTTGPTPVVRNRSTSPNPVIRASQAVDSLAPTGGTAGADGSAYDEIAPSDLIPVDTSDRLRRSRTVVVIVACAAIVLLAAFGLWGVATSDGGTSAPGATAVPIDQATISQATITQPKITQATITPPKITPPKITVEPIPVQPHATAGEIAMTAEPPRTEAAAAKPAPAIAPPNPRMPRDASHRPVRKEPLAVFTRDQLGQKFQLVRREYDSYKSKFGSRLEREWGELATFIQYMPASDDDAGRREAARRLDAFRARMRE